jgi:soluble lytic murein transglycosylase-like protein
MAYAIPTPKPSDAVAAIQSVEIASADPAMAADAMADTAALKTRSLGDIPVQGLDQPELSASTALVDDKPDSLSDDPFVTTKKTDLNQLINKYAALYDVPESLVHHVVRRETNYNPSAVHRGNWGLMQIRYNTAKGLGYRGNPNGLLDAETNLKYAVKYLHGAWIVADKDARKADWLYRTGYYYEAKKKQLLDKLDMQ